MNEKFRAIFNKWFWDGLSAGPGVSDSEIESHKNMAEAAFLFGLKTRSKWYDDNFGGYEVPEDADLEEVFRNIGGTITIYIEDDEDELLFTLPPNLAQQLIEKLQGII